MIDQNNIKQPTKKEVLTLRLIIIIGVLSTINFFYWFLKPELIGDVVLYYSVAIVILFDTFKVLYIWYHYWSIKIPIKPNTFKKLTADVLTTYFPGEPYEMITQTLLAIKEISYPHTTYLCDEANDEFLKKLTGGRIQKASIGRINNQMIHALPQNESSFFFEHCQPWRW